MRHTTGFTQGRRESLSTSWDHPPHKPKTISSCSQNTSSNDAADQQGPPKADITQFGWEVKGSIPSLCVGTRLPAPQGPIRVINCGCKSEGKACSTESCNCHTNNVSCTVYCACSAADECTHELIGTSREQVWVETCLKRVVLI